MSPEFGSQQGGTRHAPESLPFHRAEVMLPYLETVADVVRLADVVDVLLVAAIFFVVISWVRGAQSGSAARRMLVLVLLYVLVFLAAEWFQLYLMQRVLGVLLFMVVIALVVVFQSDIRRLLDRLGSLQLRAEGTSGPPDSPVQLLQEAALHLAARRIGALIAIRGRDPWQSHLHGGVQLDGRLSGALLHSIFDPDTPGHDGAVLLVGDRITRFGVHLPLATRLPTESRAGGTRHAAALGLASECDALVVVVSEERGVVSIAERGDLVEMANAAELGARLERFWKQHYAGDAHQRAPWTRRGVGNAALSLTLAVVTWFLLVFSGDIISRTLRAPIEVRNLPEGWRMQSDTLRSVLVTLSGPEQAFERLDPGELTVSFNLANPEPGANQLAITEKTLGLPSGLDLVEADPSTVTVRLERQRRISLPVQVRTEGELPEGATIVTAPEMVEVLVPDEGDYENDRIPTQPVDAVRLLEGPVTGVPLLLPPDVRLAPGQSAQVDVRLAAPAAPAAPN